MLITEISSQLANDDLLEVAKKHMTEPNQNIKKLKSPYGNYSAIRFAKKDNILHATSNKWSNIQFNFKGFLLDILPHVAATSSFVSANMNKTSTSLAILSALGIWKTILDHKSVNLSEAHAELIKSIVDLDYKEGHTINLVIYEALKLKFDIKGWNLDSTIKDLKELKILQHEHDPFYLMLREKVIIG